MIRVTLKDLQRMGACEGGIRWFLNHKQRTIKTLIPALLGGNRPDYACWLIVRYMTHPQRIMLAIYAAERSIAAYETQYPSDTRPRQSIQAAKDFLAGKIDASAAYSAASAAYSAASAYSAATSAAYNAAYSAYSAATSTYSAAGAAKGAAYSAASAAYSAYSAYSAATSAYSAAGAAESAAYKKILAYGLFLLGEGKRP